MSHNIARPSQSFQFQLELGGWMRELEVGFIQRKRELSRREKVEWSINCEETDPISFLCWWHQRRSSIAFIRIEQSRIFQ